MERLRTALLVAVVLVSSAIVLRNGGRMAPAPPLTAPPGLARAVLAVRGMT